MPPEQGPGALGLRSDLAEIIDERSRTEMTRLQKEKTTNEEVCNMSNGGSRILEPLLVFAVQCPLRVQISQGLGPFFQIELLKTGHTAAFPNPRVPAARLFTALLLVSVFSSIWESPEVGAGDKF